MRPMPQLGEFDGQFGLRVLRDGAFEGPGKLSTHLPGRLVPVRSERFVSEANGTSHVSAVITLPGLEDAFDDRLAVAVCEDPDAAHAEIHMLFAGRHEEFLRATPSAIHPDAHIDGRASVAPYGVSVAAGAVIGPNVVLSPGTVIEEDVVLRPGCVIGDPAFNLGRAGGRRRILPSLGGVRIGRGAELAAHVCVDAAMFGGETRVGEETAIDHHAYLAHDVQLGRLVTVCAHAAIMGRVVIGQLAYVGPGAVIVNGAVIGAGASITMGAVVTRDVAEKARVSGNFALPHGRFLEILRRDRDT